MYVRYQGLRSTHDVEANIQPGVVTLTVRAGFKRKTKADVVLTVEELEYMVREAKGKLLLRNHPIKRN